MKLKIQSEYQPTEDQLKAIRQLAEGVNRGDRFQTLLRVTGWGNMRIVAKMLGHVKRPMLVIWLLSLFVSFIASSCSSNAHLRSDQFLGLWLGVGMQEIRDAVQNKEGWSITDSSDNIIVMKSDGQEQVEFNLRNDSAVIIAHDWFYAVGAEATAIRQYDSLLGSITSLYGPPDDVNDSLASRMDSRNWNVDRGTASFRVGIAGLCGWRSLSKGQDDRCRVSLGIAVRHNPY